MTSDPSSPQEQRSEIDARAPTFQAFENFGEQLLTNNHYQSPDIEEKMNELAADREGKLSSLPLFLYMSAVWSLYCRCIVCLGLEKAWNDRNRKLDQCLDLQMFNRDCEQAENWMEAREMSLKQQGKH